MHIAFSLYDLIQWINISVGLFVLCKVVTFIATNFDHYSRIILAPWYRDSHEPSPLEHLIRAPYVVQPRIGTRRTPRYARDVPDLPITYDSDDATHGGPCDCGRQILDDHNTQVLSEERSVRVAEDKHTSARSPMLPPIIRARVPRDENLNSSQGKSLPNRDLW